jgi:hypothetical protein
MMNEGLIYLIQPTELIGTGRYKIGYSRFPSIKRLKSGYAVDTIIYLAAACPNAKDVETVLLRKFRLEFERVGQGEYFKGDVYKMRSMVWEEINQQYQIAIPKKPNEVLIKINHLVEITYGNESLYHPKNEYFEHLLLTNIVREGSNSLDEIEKNATQLKRQYNCLLPEDINCQPVGLLGLLFYNTQLNCGDRVVWDNYITQLPNGVKTYNCLLFYWNGKLQDQRLLKSNIVKKIQVDTSAKKIYCINYNNEYVGHKPTIPTETFTISEKYPWLSKSANQLYRSNIKRLHKMYPYF